MPTVTKYAPGTPSYVDLGTPDVDAAATFYSGLFGWEVVDMGPDAGGYRQAQLDGNVVAGLGPATNPGPPFWSQYVSVEDADATAAKITAAGGTLLVPPTDVFTAGRMAVFLDSTGAPCSLWQPGDSIGAALVNDPGSFGWSELATRQIDESKKFYGAVFGWTSEDMPMPDGSSYTVWRNGERMIAGMMPIGEQFPAEVPNHWGIYFVVDDTDASAAKAKELGGAVHVEPTDIPPGRFALIRDPQGAMFYIIAWGAPPDDPNVG